MERIRDRVAGLDVHRDKVAACVRLADGGRTKMLRRSFSTMATGVAELAGWLSEHGVTTAVMESTGVYWKPIYYGLEGLVPELWLVNAMHVKRVPGRKDRRVRRGVACRCRGARHGSGELRAAASDQGAAGADPLPQDAGRCSHS